MSRTLTNCRCGGCGVSLSPQIPDDWGDDPIEWDCGYCRFPNIFRLGSRPELTVVRKRNVLGTALSECSAAFAGLTSHGVAREVIEVLRSGTVTIDPLTEAKLRGILRIPAGA